MTPLRQRQGSAQTVVIPAPVGGLNTRDALDAMKPTDAIGMTNLYVAPDGVRIRRGHTTFRTGVGSGAVETIAEYRAGTTQKLIAAGGGAVYDATVQAPTSLATGFSEDAWQTAMMEDSSAGAVLGMVNGADTPQYFNGTALNSLTITGVTGSTLSGIFVFKSRSYFWSQNSQSFWYSAVNRMGDAVTAFPLGRVSAIAGNMLAMSSISMDAGSGPDDFAVFIMTSGDVLVYQGSNPGDANDWALVGIFKTAAPVNIRSVTKWGGDCLILTRRGLVSVKKMMGAASEEDTTVSNRISPTLIGAVTAAIDLDGIELEPFGTDDILIVNTPRSAATFDQYVMSLSNGAWGGPWQSIPARCWGVYDSRLFAGGVDGTIWEYTGVNDNGTAISADAQTAFNVVGKRGRIKHLSALRPVVTASGSVSAAAAAQFDYRAALVGTPEAILAQSLNWEDDDELWEVDSIAWGDEDESTDGMWFLGEGHGYAASVRLAFSANGSARWESTALQVYEGAGWL